MCYFSNSKVLTTLRNNSAQFNQKALVSCYGQGHGPPTRVPMNLSLCLRAALDGELS